MSAGWSCAQEWREGNRVRHFAPLCDGQRIATAAVWRLWREDAGFRRFFAALLARADFAAYRWETPGVTRATAGQDFEFVLCDAGTGAAAADVETFAEHFDMGAQVVSFGALSRKTLLIAPVPRALPVAMYANLARFMRGAPQRQVDALWREVGARMAEACGTAPVWLSTAGGGVDYLHVRIDPRPKYYRYAPYRTEACRAQPER